MAEECKIKKKKNKFYMLVGLPGSGKSSLAEKIKKEQESHSKGIVLTKIREEIEEAVKAGYDVIYDECNISRKRRRELLNSLNSYDLEKICLVCATPYEVCLKRNSQSDRMVQEEVIKKDYLNWNTPYYDEGWDRIELCYTKDSEKSYGFYKDYAEKYMTYQQYSPYHQESLGEHLQWAKDYLVDKKKYSSKDNVSVAALIHDCGKPFTQMFEDGNGNKTEIARYYQHECIGAYDAFFFHYPGKTKEDVLEISLLINLHMKVFDWRRAEGALEKQKLKLRNKLYNNLIHLNEADESAKIVLQGFEVRR